MAPFSGLLTMPSPWFWLTEFGDSKWLLPAVAVLIFVSIRSSSLSIHKALRWSGAIAVTALIVLGSKLAFMGWGIGSAGLDFTGFSGHASMSSAIYPTALVVLGNGRGLSKNWLAATGFAWAALIAFSRLPLHAHSVSEVVTGFALGSAASAFTLSNWSSTPQKLTVARWLIPAAIVVVCLQFTTPSISTHKLVSMTAKGLSGRDDVYTRQWLHSCSEKSPQNLVQAVDITGFLRHSLNVRLAPTDFRRFP